MKRIPRPYNAIVVPRKYIIEIELMAVDAQLSRFGRLAVRLVAAGALALAVAWVAVAT